MQVPASPVLTCLLIFTFKFVLQPFSLQIFVFVSLPFCLSFYIRWRVLTRHDSKMNDTETHQFTGTSIPPTVAHRLRTFNGPHTWIWLLILCTVHCTVINTQSHHCTCFYYYTQQQLFQKKKTAEQKFHVKSFLKQKVRS